MTGSEIKQGISTQGGTIEATTEAPAEVATPELTGEVFTFELTRQGGGPGPFFRGRERTRDYAFPTGHVYRYNVDKAQAWLTMNLPKVCIAWAGQCIVARVPIEYAPEFARRIA